MPLPLQLRPPRSDYLDTEAATCALLRRHGLRPSAMRVGLYRILCEAASSERLLTPEDVYQAFRRRGEPASLPALYNALSQLADAELIERYRLGEGPALFRRQHAERLSALLVCGRCHQISGVQSPSLTAQMQALAEEQQFTLAEPTVVLRGRCAACDERASHVQPS